MELMNWMCARAGVRVHGAGGCGGGGAGGGDVRITRRRHGVRAGDIAVGLGRGVRGGGGGGGGVGVPPRLLPRHRLALAGLPVLLPLLTNSVYSGRRNKHLSGMKICSVMLASS